MTTSANIEYSDSRRELHRERHPDTMSAEEALAEWEYVLEQLQAGDESSVPTWMTLEQCIYYTEERIEQLREEITNR